MQGYFEMLETGSAYVGRPLYDTMPRCTELTDELQTIRDETRDEILALKDNRDRSEVWKAQQEPAIHAKGSARRAAATSEWMARMDAWQRKLSAIAIDPSDRGIFDEECSQVRIMLANRPSIGGDTILSNRFGSIVMRKDQNRLLAWSTLIDTGEIVPHADGIADLIGEAEENGSWIDLKFLEWAGNMSRIERNSAEEAGKPSPLEGLMANVNPEAMAKRLEEAKRQDRIASDNANKRPNWGAGGTITYGGRPRA